VAIDVTSKYFVVNIDECAKTLSEQDLDQLQGMIKRVDMLSRNEDKYHVFVLSKGTKAKRQSVEKNDGRKK
jgi:hypothetical protein